MKDKLGIFFSSLCLCHCLLTPLLILLMGTNFFLGALEAQWMHKLVLLPVLIIALSSIPRSWLATRNQWLLIVASIGLITIITAQFSHGVNEVWLTMLGSICLIGAHFISLNLAKAKATS